MIQRSGVPVQNIMECNNGQIALDILNSQKIDVMFTDIRMPKMDGIELVEAMQKLEHKPLTVAISGYDDFTYAVQLLRMGVKEYILKPVEREQIVQILKKLEEEIQKNNEIDREAREIGCQQLKYMILNEHITEKESRQWHSGLRRNCCRRSMWCAVSKIPGRRRMRTQVFCALGILKETVCISLGGKTKNFY